MEFSKIAGKNGKSYDFIDIIGHGAFGEVWKATCKALNEEFAIKVVNNKGLEYCQRETSIHSKLRHDSILQFYEEINICGSKCLVLEYCPNGNLQEYIDKNHKLAESEAHFIFKKVANGVAYLHYKNIVHRDLKPANLLLANAMDVKIADFGQAIELNGKVQCTGLYGTVPYYSPEMLERRPYRMETDCWSMGCILYFLLAGKPPFNCSHTGNSIRNAEYIVLSRLSRSANNLIRALLTKDQEKRMSAYGILSHPFITEEKSKLATYSFDSGMHSGIISTKDSQNTQMPFRSHSAGTFTSGLGSMISSGPYSFRTNDKNSIDMRNCYGHTPPVRLSPSPQHIITNQKFMPTLKENILPNRQLIYRYCDDKREAQLRPIHGRERDVSEERRRIKISKDRSKQPSYCDEFVRKSCNESLQGRNVQQYNTSSHSNLDTTNKGSSASNQLCKKCSGNLSNVRIRSQENILGNNDYPLIPPDNNDNHSCSSIKSDHCCHRSHHSELVNHKCKHRGHCPSGKHTNHSCTSACSCSSSCCESHHQPEQNSRLATDIKNGIAAHSSIDYDPSCHTSLEAHDVYRPNSEGHKNQVCHKQPQSKRSNSQESCISVLQNLPPPIKVIRLKPQRIRLNNNMYTILKSGKLCVEVIGNNIHGNDQLEYVIAVYVISEDGMKIIRYKPKGIGLPLSDRPLSAPSRAYSSFSYNNLPQKYWKVYHVAAKFINFIRSTTRKVTFYTELGSFILMENSPDADFVGCFISGGKIKKSGESIQITNNGNVFNVNSEDEVYSLGEKIVDMWKHFCQCHEHCRKIEADVERNTDNDIFSRFPLTIGSKKHPIRAIKNESSSLSLYSPNSTGTSETNTVLTDATNLIEKNHHFAIKKGKLMLQDNQLDMKSAALKIGPRNDAIQQIENVPNQNTSQNSQLYNINAKKANYKIMEVHINRIDKLNDRTVVVYSDNTKVSFAKVKPVDKIYYWTHGEWKCYSVNDPRMIKELPPDLRQRLAMLGPENFRDIGVT